MGNGIKRSRVKRLVSSAVLCAVFSLTSINSAFAEDWSGTQSSPFRNNTYREINDNVNVTNDYNINTADVIIKGSTDTAGNLIIKPDGVLYNSGTSTRITIENTLKIEDTYSGIYNDGEIITNELENQGVIGGIITQSGEESLGQLTISNGGFNTGVIQQNTISLNGAGTFENVGEIKATGALGILDGATVLKNDEGGEITATSMSNAGTFANYGYVVIENLINTSKIDGLDVGGGVIKYGNMTLTGNSSSSGSITQGNLKIENSTFTNESSAVLTLTESLNVDSGSRIDNSGEITVSGSNYEGILINNGIINNVSGSITADSLTNNGDINLNKSSLKLVNQVRNVGGTINATGDGNVFDSNGDFIGKLNVGTVTQTSTLKLDNVEITDSAVVNLIKGSTIELDKEAWLAINEEDSFKGDVIATNGSLFIEGVNLTLGNESTKTSAGNNPYFNMSGDNSDLVINNAVVSMVDSSILTGGNIGITKFGEYHSLKNGFSINNLETAGLLNAINDNSETYNINNIMIAEQDGDSTADFAIDMFINGNTIEHDVFDSNVIEGSEENQTGKIYIADWKMHGDLYDMSDFDFENTKLEIFKGDVKDGHDITFGATDKKLNTIVKSYRLASAGNGTYSFKMSGYNPTAFRGQVTKMAQYQNQLAINDMLFNHTMLNQGFKGNDVIGGYSSNRYASSGDLFAPYQYSRKDGGLWVKSYASFEKLNMNHGLNVGNNSYGTIIGADLGLKELNNGWSFMPTAYVGYNGANQYWKGTGAYQNGVQAGFLGTWYKDNLILGALTFAGAYGNSMETPNGTDDTMNYFAGAATKVAYNYKLTENLALQPNLLLSYSYFGQENWHANFGQMGMMSGMMHGINIAPGANLIWEKDTFSAYATIQYMYNINQSVGGRAGNVNIANVHMDRGYLQYGVGFNKKFTDRFSGYFQTVVRNVGRTGIAFMLGFNWKLGKDVSNKNITSSNIPELKKTKISLGNF